MSVHDQPTRTRKSAEERREEIVALAIRQFALGGYKGTSTETIAAEAGISQPYLFRLFGTKRDLFLACVDVNHERIETTFAQAAEGAPPGEALGRMGDAYVDRLRDTSALLFQMQSYAACSDPVIQERVRDRFGVLVAQVTRLSGAEPEAGLGVLRARHAAQRDGVARPARDRRGVGVGRAVVRARGPDPAGPRPGDDRPAAPVRRRHRAGARGRAALARVGARALVRRPRPERRLPRRGRRPRRGGREPAARCARSRCTSPPRPAVGPLDVAATVERAGRTLLRVVSVRIEQDGRADDARARHARRAARGRRGVGRGAGAGRPVRRRARRGRPGRGRASPSSCATTTCAGPRPARRRARLGRLAPDRARRARSTGRSSPR